MSNAANWSYTAEATIWPLTGRDDWTGALTYGQPVVFSCSYSAETKTRTDARGQEYISRQVIYCERAGIKPGDLVSIGNHSTIPTTAEAVMDVLRDHDVFENAADDFKVIT